MKKVLWLSVVAVVCLSVVALAGGDKKMGDKKGDTGTITKLDMTGKMMTVKAGETAKTVYWNDETKVEGGELKEGATVHFKTTEKDGKTWATWVHVGEMKKM